MLLCGITDNILISNPSHSIVYQDEDKVGDLQRDKYFFGFVIKPKNWQNSGACYSCTNWDITNLPTEFLKLGWV